MSNKFISDIIELTKNENNAVYMGINHIDIIKIKGMEFYHLFMFILMKTPSEIGPEFVDRAKLFYDVKSRDLEEENVIYFSSNTRNEKSIWETTISASSECAYDTTAKKMGNLIKVPNFDRMGFDKTGKRVFVKRIAVNNLGIIRRLLDYENKYDNSLKYALIPEATKKGYNSNSFFRGALEYASLIDYLEVPSCFKSPGLSKAVSL